MFFLYVHVKWWSQSLPLQPLWFVREAQAQLSSQLTPSPILGETLYSFLPPPTWTWLILMVTSPRCFLGWWMFNEFYDLDTKNMIVIQYSLQNLEFKLENLSHAFDFSRWHNLFVFQEHSTLVKRQCQWCSLKHGWMMLCWIKLQANGLMDGWFASGWGL